MLIKICLFLFCINLIGAHKILVVFPIPGTSHSILGHGQVNLLLKAGHEVTYLTGVPMQSTHPKLRQIYIHENDGFNLSDVFHVEKLMKKEVHLQDTYSIKQIMNLFANNTITNDKVQKIMNDPNEKFDVAIVEWMYTEIYSGFSYVFGCPYIWFSSMEPHAMVLDLIDGYPNPAYVPDHMSDVTPPFTFWQRIKELWTQIYLRYVISAYSTTEESIFDNGFRSALAKRGRTLPTYKEAKYSAALMLGNSHASSGLAVPLPQSFKQIAGYHIEENVKPLPEELQKIMDNAKHGVIYFSMGSVLRGASFPRELINAFLEIFKGLKQTVIWKFEEELKDIPKNVHILKWTPQQSILAHPNCILFISHGGLLSTAETLHFGVPIIGMPGFADQFINIVRAQQKGFGIMVKLNFELPNKLKSAIEEMVTNPRYRNRVKGLSSVYHDRIATPKQEFVFWVEHVVRTHGASYLRSPAVHMQLYEKLYLDLIALIIIIVVLTLQIFKCIFITKQSGKVTRKTKVQ